jgi:hypothetical protein
MRSVCLIYFEPLNGAVRIAGGNPFEHRLDQLGSP